MFGPNAEVSVTGPIRIIEPGEPTLLDLGQLLGPNTAAKAKYVAELAAINAAETAAYEDLRIRIGHSALATG